jgi:hypothetical protein
MGAIVTHPTQFDQPGKPQLTTRTKPGLRPGLPPKLDPIAIYPALQVIAVFAAGRGDDSVGEFSAG